MKNLMGFILLFFFACSLFFLILTPFEMYKTRQVRSWTPVEVEVMTSQLQRVNADIALIIELRNVQTGEMSGRVAIRHGDVSLSLTGFGIFLSTLNNDKALYPVGKKLIAYQSPDKLNYVLEQNTLTEMFVVLLLACLYPGYTIWHVIKTRKDDAEDS